MKFKIINGKIYDPSQGINGREKDLFIDNGLIVEPKKNELSKFNRIIDASGLIVMAGAIDIHSHIAGGNVNNARLLSPEIHSNFLEINLQRKKYLPGFNSRWTSEGTGYRYAEMGFTTVVEPAVLPINAFMTHLEIEKIPMIDKGCLCVIGNDGFLLEALNKKKGQSFIDDYVAWNLDSSKCIGLKVINAGGTELFKFSGESETFNIDDIVPEYGVTSRQILESLNEANENLNIPHPVHVHCNNLGTAGNVDSILATIDAAKGRRMHLTHIQFYSYGNEGKKGFSSASLKLAEAINKNKNISADIGQVMFKPTVTISSDIWKQNQAKSNANPNKWMISEIEDGGGGIIPYEYKENNFVNALQWAIGLELFLQINDPWRVFLTTDHPNGAPFTSYPELIRLLMDSSFRNAELEKINIKAKEMSYLKSLKRTYSYYDIAIMTRAAPARILGLKDRGSLKKGSIADISIYNPNKPIDKMFEGAEYVFKNGIQIVKNGSVTRHFKTKTECVKLQYDKKIHKEIKKWFDNFYSLNLKEFEIDEKFFSHENFHVINQ